MLLASVARMVTALTVAAGPALASATVVQDAERQAAEAVRLAKTDRRAAEAAARRALALSADFDPTHFAAAGRKGEMVEDAYVAARHAYRRHRAVVYDALGAVKAAAGDTAAALRFYRRAALLDHAPKRAVALARALLASGQPGQAVAVLREHAAEGLGVDGLALLQEAVDAAGLASAQIEIDRARLRALPGGVELADGALVLPPGLRLSTGAPLTLSGPAWIAYLAEPSCRSCSADLQALRKAAPDGARVVVVPASAEEDHALRQVVALYKHPWPVLVGPGARQAFGAAGRSAVVLGRGGWARAAVAPPYLALADVVATLARTDVAESLPRGGYVAPADGSRRVVPPIASQPGLLPEKLAPGEDEPAPPEFASAVEAYRKKAYAQAMAGFEALEARGDGWLMTPEARLNRAWALAGLGRRDEARRLLLKTGDSRFQEAVDRALEEVARTLR